MSRSPPASGGGAACLQRDDLKGPSGAGSQEVQRHMERVVPISDSRGCSVCNL